MKGCFEPIFHDRSYQRIYVDLPGMGNTKAVDWLENADTMLEILIKFVKEIIPDGQFLMVSESYGSYLARGIIKNMPEKIAGSLFLCPCVIPDNEKRTVPEHEVLVKLNVGSFSDSDDYADFNDIAVIQTQKTWRRYRNEVLPGVKSADHEFLKRYWSDGYGFSFDVDTVEERYGFPTMFLLGKQDSSVGYKDAWNLLEHYGSASFMVIDGAGHNLQIEQEEIFYSSVCQWLKNFDRNA